jgi:L-asparagine transporter-like permease
MQIRDLFRTKSLDALIGETQEEGHKLKKVLGPVNLIALGIGAIIGAGIFATIGTAAAGDASRPGAGPALMLSFVLTAIVCGFTALCYAEFASMVPVSGSAYTYSYATLGELVAWIIGWDLLIEYAIGNVAVAISWANYFNELIAGAPYQLPGWLKVDYHTALTKMPQVVASAPHIFGIPIIFNILAVGIVALITLVLVWGVRESAGFNFWMVLIKLVVLGFFAFVSFKYVNTDNWHPFAPNGFRGVLTGASIVFFAYIGFDAVSTTAEEAKNPKRDMPIGIIGSLIICTLIYAVIAAIFTGLIPYSALVKMLSSEQAEPLTMAMKFVHLLRHVARRPAAEVLFTRSQALPDAARGHDHHRRLRRRGGAVLVTRRDGGPDQYRDAVRLPARLYRDRYPAGERPGPRARLPRSGRHVVPSNPRRGLVPHPGQLPPVDIMEALRHLARNRAGRLLLVRLEQQPSASSGKTRDRGRWPEGLQPGVAVPGLGH